MSVQILPGGHCMYCHKDYEEYGSEHSCQKKAKQSLEKGKWEQPTSCTDKCSMRYRHGNTIEGKLDYIIHMLEAKKDNQ